MNILIIDDEPSVGLSLQGILEDEGHRVRVALNGEDGLEAAAKQPFDFALLDVMMPGGMDGLQTLERLRKEHPSVGVLMISGHGTIELAVRAVKLGALDFIEKPLSLDSVLSRLEQAQEKKRLLDENATLRAELDDKYAMIGDSAAIREVLRIVERIAPTNGRALITGESGTGKELVARAIHRNSKRAKKPFIRVNCAAIPTELIEAELFGYERGAFTGAANRHRGRFEQADGGTLFLDEVGDMAPQTQAKVLRVLEEGQFERLGGSETLSGDVRVIAATNRDLKSEIAKGHFREDLYYRLNVVPIHVPPLRERREDIPLLVDHFLRRYCAENGKALLILSPTAAEILNRYDWHGNIRELRNLIERLVIMTPGAEVMPEDLPEDMRKPPVTTSLISTASDVGDAQSLRDARDSFELAHIRKVLDETGWNVSETAKRLGLERSHLHRKMRQANLRRDSK